MSKRAYIAGVLTGLLFYFPACGGGQPGPGSTPPAPQPLVQVDTADRYLTQFFPRTTHGVVVLYSDHTQITAEWDSAPGWDQFGTAREFSSRHTCNGADYATSDGYGDATGMLYAIEAVINRITVDGRTTDLAQACPAMPPIMLPWLLPASGDIVEEQYFWIHDAAGNRNRPGYWRGVWTVGLSAFNPCWLGTGPNLRPVATLRECWWDSYGGWVRCHPTQAGALPWQGGVPVDIETVSDVYDSYGRDVGPLWRASDNGIELCLRNS